MSEADEFVNHIRQFFHSSEIDELENDLHEAYDEIETLRARVAELEEAHRWIPVTERLPDYSIHVYAYLGHLANSANIMKLVRQYDNTWRNVAGWEYTGITHWQPLPSGPKEAT